MAPANRFYGCMAARVTSDGSRCTTNSRAILPSTSRLIRDLPGLSGRCGWNRSSIFRASIYGSSRNSVYREAIFAGHFIGGWLAAEMAVMSPQIVARLLLLDPAGVRPREGEIADIFLHGSDGTRQLSFFDVKQVADYALLFGTKPSPEAREAHIINREAATRYCWKPYMHDPGLPPLLERLRDIPTLVICGREDRIAPVECGELYRGAIAGARLEVIDRCGHFPHFEKPAEFWRAASAFLLADGGTVQH